MAYCSDAVASARIDPPTKSVSDADSPTSSQSSPQSSIFSSDTQSSQSSAPSCSPSNSSDTWEQLVEVNSLGQLQLDPRATTAGSLTDRSQSSEGNGGPATCTGSDVSQLRQNPRRTFRPKIPGTKDFKPPQLVRQCERKEEFVDGLVDTATQMIETIWPLSNYPCGSNGIPVDKDVKTVSGLRTYVQELLRRSRTSYSTLQVALYYLIVIQCCLPKRDFTQEQTRESHARISLQCGRRMFLAALILAGKYLQDKTYSARAWSKISGLSPAEINLNERRFLEAVAWKLHVPEEIFHRWTDIVFKYSPARSPSSPGPVPLSPNIWKSLIPRLTAELDNVELNSDCVDNDSGYESSSSKESSSLDSPPLRPYTVSVSPLSRSPTDEGLNALPTTLEPTPYEYTSIAAAAPPPPPPPPITGLGFLPTPVLTPKNCNISTPAASAYSSLSRKSSMSLAMGEVRRSSLARATLDRVDTSMPSDLLCRRRSSLQHFSKTASPTSAPSSVTTFCHQAFRTPSSVTSSQRAIFGHRLAKPAVRRCVTMKESDSPELQQQLKRSATLVPLRCVQDMALQPPRGPGDFSTEALDSRDEIQNCTTPTAYNTSTTGECLNGQSQQQSTVAAEPRPTSQRAFSTQPSRKRERPLSMDLSNGPSSVQALRTPVSQTSSNSSTPRPCSKAEDGMLTVPDDENAVSNSNASEVASQLVQRIPDDLVSKPPMIGGPANKVQKTQKWQCGHAKRFSALSSTFVSRATLGEGVGVF